MATTTHSEKRTCPCKNLPWSLSSFTAAEYGDVRSLMRTRPGPEVWKRRDSAGYTPLHLAAQHNHVLATTLLLKMGADVNGENDHADEPNFATPLHRAAFSGATATMRLLMQEPKCNLLARDTSFGDLKTPLHKAVAGGRYLAVQLLLEELRQRNQLSEGLQAKDASSKTPLQVAEEICPYQEENRKGVARWDEIAGGVADWEKCRALLLRAVRSATSDQRPGTVTPTTSFENTQSLPPLPTHLATLDGCLNCETGGGAAGKCLTSSWQAAFEAALGNSVDLALGSDDRQQRQDRSTSIGYSATSDTRVQMPRCQSSVLPSPPSASGNGITDSPGVSCMTCGQKTVSLYRSPKGLFVCKSCQRRIS